MYSIEASYSYTDVALSVCLCVCVFFTLVSSAKTAERIVNRFGAWIVGLCRSKEPRAAQILTRQGALRGTCVDQLSIEKYSEIRYSVMTNVCAAVAIRSVATISVATCYLHVQYV